MVWYYQRLNDDRLNAIEVFYFFETVTHLRWDLYHKGVVVMQRSLLVTSSYILSLESYARKFFEIKKRLKMTKNKRVKVPERVGSQGRMLRLFKRREAQRLMKIYFEMLEMQRHSDDGAFYQELQERFNQETSDDKEVWEVRGQVLYMIRRLKAGNYHRRNFFRDL